MKARRRQVRGVIVIVEYYIILIKIVVDVPWPRILQSAAEGVSFLEKIMFSLRKVVTPKSAPFVVVVAFF